jgi:NodT family efflux transporter outer membrane factor (OMF) lipoprotein
MLKSLYFTRYLLAALAVTGLLSACAVGPDFHRPAAPKNASYQAGGVPAKTVARTKGEPQVFLQTDQVRSDWYRLFQNDRLSALIKTALADNPTIKAGQARLQAAREEVKAARGGLFPQVDVGASAQREHASGIQLGIDNPEFANTFNLYQGKVSVGYHLDIFGRVRRQLENQKAQLNFHRYRLLNTYLTLIDNIVATSLAEAGINSTIAATQRIVDAQKGTAELLRKQEKYGATNRNRVLQAQAQLANTKATLPPLLRQQALAEDRLATLVGQSPGQFQDPQFQLSDFKLPEKLPVTLPSRLVRRRPDILAAQSLMHAASAEIGVTEAQRLPDFTLSAAYGRAALTPSDLTDPVTALWHFGAALMAPIFHGGALRARNKAAVDLYKAAAADYYTTALNAFREVADNLRSLESDAKGIDARRKAMQAAKDSLDLARKQYKVGAVDYLTLYTTQRQYQHAVIRYTQARLQRYKDTAGLFRALGGGWWDTALLQDEEDKTAPPSSGGDNTARRDAADTAN